MVDCIKYRNPSYDVVFPSQFARLLIEYQEHPEAKSLAPDCGPCVAGTRGLLRRAHINAGELRYIGKETDRKWEEGDEISVLEFKATEFGRSKKVVADISLRDKIRAIGIRKTMELTKMSQHTIERLLRGEVVKRKTLEGVGKAVSTIDTSAVLLGFHAHVPEFQSVEIFPFGHSSEMCYASATSVLSSPKSHELPGHRGVVCPARVRFPC